MTQEHRCCEEGTETGPKAKATRASLLAADQERGLPRPGRTDRGPGPAAQAPSEAQLWQERNVTVAITASGGPPGLPPTS
jgi:hypothetical protein